MHNDLKITETSWQTLVDDSYLQRRTNAFFKLYGKTHIGKATGASYFHIICE